MHGFMDEIREHSRYGKAEHLDAPRTFEQGLANIAAGKTRSKRSQKNKKDADTGAREAQRAWQARLVQKKWGSTDAKRLVLERVTQRSYSSHETVIRQGDAADAMYFLQRGELDVVVGGARVHVLRAGDFFGEYALLSEDGVRTATIVARGPSPGGREGGASCRVLSRADFEAILHQHPNFEAELRPKRRYVMDMNSRRQKESEGSKPKGGKRATRTIVYRPRKGSLADLIMRYAAGNQKGTGRGTSDTLVRQQRFQAGDAVCTQGEVAGAMYFVLAGKLDVEVSGQKVHTTHEGEFFGEHALLRQADGVAGKDDERRTATVRVADNVPDCVLMVISKDALLRILAQHPEVRSMLDVQRGRAGASKAPRTYITEKHVAFQRRQQQQLEELGEDERAAGDMEMYTIENLMRRAALQVSCSALLRAAARCCALLRAAAPACSPAACCPASSFRWCVLLTHHAVWRLHTGPPESDSCHPPLLAAAGPNEERPWAACEVRRRRRRCGRGPAAAAAAAAAAATRWEGFEWRR